MELDMALSYSSCTILNSQASPILLQSANETNPRYAEECLPKMPLLCNKSSHFSHELSAKTTYNWSRNPEREVYKHVHYDRLRASSYNSSVLCRNILNLAWPCCDPHASNSLSPLFPDCMSCTFIRPCWTLFDVMFVCVNRRDLKRNPCQLTFCLIRTWNIDLTFCSINSRMWCVMHHGSSTIRQHPSAQNNRTFTPHSTKQIAPSFPKKCQSLSCSMPGPATEF